MNIFGRDLTGLDALAQGGNGHPQLSSRVDNIVALFEMSNSSHGDLLDQDVDVLVNA